MPKLLSELKAQITVLAKEEAKKRVAKLLKGVAKIVKALDKAKKGIASFQKAVGGTGQAGRKVGRPRGKKARRRIRKAQRRVAKKSRKARKAKITPAAIKALRKSLNANQEELAKMLGLSRFAVMAWEQGRSQPRAAKLAKILALQKKGGRKVKARVGRPRKARKSVRGKRGKRAVPETPPAQPVESQS